MSRLFSRTARVASLAWLAVPALAAPAGRQAAYDAAQAAYDQKDWATAAAGFLALEPTDPKVRLGRSSAVIAARLADALMRLNRVDEASSWAERAVNALPAGDEQLGPALVTRGDAARFAYDYATAITAYDRAIALAVASHRGDLQLMAVHGLAHAGVTIDPKHVAAAVDALLATPDAAKLDKTMLAQLRDLRARAALNGGDLKEAERWITKAISNSGGLGDRVNTVQAAVRGDAAIIYRLLRDDDHAQLYLAYTGAGHIKDMNWIGEFEGEPPVCDPDGVAGGVRPDDSVVVQFFLGDDGQVQGAFPVYASRPGAIGQTFAQTVSLWRWNPSAVHDVDPYWRTTLRLELRCVMRPRPTTLKQAYFNEASGWIRLHRPGTGSPPPRADDDWVKEEVVPKVVGPVRGPAGPTTTFKAALSDLDGAHAPASVYAVTAYLLAATPRNVQYSDVRGGARYRANMIGQLVPDVAQRFPTAAATAWLMLEQALALETSGAFPEAAPIIDRVLATPMETLPSDDPVRRVALLHQALIRSRQGAAAEARRSLEQSGLTSEQCTLFETRPVPQSTGMSSNDFPREAMRWRFEGHVEEAYDIGEDGRVANVRTILAYPPFIFGPSTEGAVRRFRYLPPTIGGKAVGCDGQTLRVNYRLPS